MKNLKKTLFCVMLAIFSTTSSSWAMEEIKGSYQQNPLDENNQEPDPNAEKIKQIIKQLKSEASNTKISSLFGNQEGSFYFTIKKSALIYLNN